MAEKKIGKTGASRAVAGTVTWRMKRRRHGRADLFARFTALGPWIEAGLPLRRRLYSLAVFGPAIALLLLHREARRTRKKVHQPAFVRYLLLQDVLGASLARELRLRRPDVMRSTKAAVFWVAYRGEPQPKRQQPPAIGLRPVLAGASPHEAAPTLERGLAETHTWSAHT